MKWLDNLPEKSRREIIELQNRRAAFETGRNSYGFEVDKGFYTAAKEKMLSTMEVPLFGEGVA